MAITVRSDVVDGVQAPDVTNQIAPKLRDIQAHLEPAYRIEPGGAFEESAKGNASIFILFPVMVMVMPKYLPPELSRSSRELAGSKSGSNCSAICVMAWTKPSTLAPMTLMGKRLGYSISDSLRESS
jgi:hypothetical protein